MIRKFLFYLLLLLIGIGGGAYLFSETQRRQPLDFQNCEPACLQTNEALGLLASIGVKYAADYIPDKIYETDKTVAMVHPAAKAKHHYVIVPKKDIKNIAEVSEDERVYLLDAIAVAQRIIRDKNLTTYQLVTNGPGYQDVTYLHFHLVSE
ncbi:MAG: hypothetical protein A3C85_04140 [Candidatus Doudnabacteria bacterium RIFCSPHIGHO2_02_FULL_48_21]|uniref:HIT domain-containing protein n=1 Tax=Candidatus Doudnabacteria bacterium RIFCSPLOWO2_02_FULL_48_13 TaxID=1817845 RepID=A0A1F5QAB7_9BACT|nr:MAG: hypothetical protein A2668_00540 [Candidatus Doudnabacteria bacterium RIFCSPHIGHO2_01_FULL_48_180]OGE94080.1 MAG: hypothetical protein A3C85_04140 [Candidatus Doudnabacteria bacterium RIFCSPHIGHO2_02_FULL_48_21]OGE98214.1 MAG: hypothetical protein A3A83_03535 [Candidatus Doudnabacteria bacterium RIFCSPLOWO2_01_FULL_48_57]OGE99113.1 MAG: hypothetical protein A3J05_01630 [Candidatus Doudnabacteria bacterium RIFCSPLOWO2_02_FULL_48_13]OGF02052.1 MAG: hypothetical protein A3G07_04160 [Candid